MTPLPQRIETLITRGWLRRGLLAYCLLPLAMLFRLLVGMRRLLYRSGLLRATAMPVPVIVIGNLYVGGTGKTPLVIWLADVLRQAGYRPGVISRGYGGRNTRPQAVTAASKPEMVGDEPVLIATRARCPVMVGRNRVAAAQALLEQMPEVNLIISDDGLQHYALRRDIEIVLFDGRGLGNGWMLPAGPLREPGSRPRDITVFNAARLPDGLPQDGMQMQLVGNMAESLGNRSQKKALADLSRAFPYPSDRIVAAAGIGNPARFFALLEAAGLSFRELPLPDHYDFAHNPFAGLDADLILITEKDAVKCSRINEIRDDPRIWVVPVTAELDARLSDKILEKLRGYPIA